MTGAPAAAAVPINRWATWLARNGPDLFQLSRKAGWDAFVHAAPREPLPVLTRAQLAALPEEQREDFTEARLVWNANLPTVKTSQLAGAFDNLDQVLASGRRDSDRLRRSVVIDAAPGLGKATIATRYARDLHRRVLRREGPLTPEGHQRLPVVFVPLAAGVTPKGAPPLIDYRTRRWLCTDPPRPLAAVRAARALTDEVLPAGLSDQTLARMFWQVYTGGDLHLAPAPFGRPEPWQPGYDVKTAASGEDLDVSRRVLRIVQAVLEHDQVSTGPLLTWTPAACGRGTQVGDQDHDQEDETEDEVVRRVGAAGRGGRPWRLRPTTSRWTRLSRRLRSTSLSGRSTTGCGGGWT